MATADLGLGCAGSEAAVVGVTELDGELALTLPSGPDLALPLVALLDSLATLAATFAGLADGVTDTAGALAATADVPVAALFDAGASPALVGTGVVDALVAELGTSERSVAAPLATAGDATTEAGGGPATVDEGETVAVTTPLLGALTTATPAELATAGLVTAELAAATAGVTTFVTTAPAGAKTPRSRAISASRQSELQYDVTRLATTRTNRERRGSTGF
jgi:hypothetical protein